MAAPAPEEDDGDNTLAFLLMIGGAVLILLIACAVGGCICFWKDREGDKRLKDAQQDAKRSEKEALKKEKEATAAALRKVEDDAESLVEEEVDMKISAVPIPEDDMNVAWPEEVQPIILDLDERIGELLPGKDNGPATKNQLDPAQAVGSTPLKRLPPPPQEPGLAHESKNWKFEPDPSSTELRSTPGILPTYSPKNPYENNPSPHPITAIFNGTPSPLAESPALLPKPPSPLVGGVWANAGPQPPYHRPAYHSGHQLPSQMYQVFGKDASGQQPPFNPMRQRQGSRSPYARPTPSPHVVQVSPSQLQTPDVPRDVTATPPAIYDFTNQNADVLMLRKEWQDGVKIAEGDEPRKVKKDKKDRKEKKEKKSRK
ncbi:hypothetical protein DIPPA_17066 [Diplonema papillatum]|nr:hypothetical protein DIPPA_17066 [Diplonema papillatum]